MARWRVRGWGFGEFAVAGRVAGLDTIRCRYTVAAVTLSRRTFMC